MFPAPRLLSKPCLLVKPRLPAGLLLVGPDGHPVVCQEETLSVPVVHQVDAGRERSTGIRTGGVGVEYLLPWVDIQVT